MEMKIDFSKLTLREKVLQTFCSCPHDIKREKSFKNFFEKYPVGSVYCANSVVDADLGNLMIEDGLTVGNFMEECRKYTTKPLILCADGMAVEGTKSAQIGMPLTSCENAVELAYDCGKSIAMKMYYNDIDWILTPCMDMDYCKYAIQRLGRNGTDDPKYNVEVYSELIKGLQENGTISTVKHFPGVGENHVNGHMGPDVNNMDLDLWMKTYGYCYKELFKTGVLSVMTTHTALPCWTDEDENGYMPIATYSHKITTGLLKEELGFEGVVVTDALTMGGCGFGDQIAEAVQAFKAGADVLLWPPLEACDEIVKQLESGEIPMSRLDDALSRIAKLREYIDEHKGKRIEADKEFINATAEKVLNGAPELYRNNINALPLKKENNERILVIGNAMDDHEMGLIKNFAQQLKDKGYNVDFQEYLLTCFVEEIRAITDPYDKVIVVFSHHYMLAHGHDENGREGRCCSTIWASHLVEREKAIFVNYGLQYMAEDYYPRAHTFVNMNQPISEDSVKFAVEKICGESEFTGKARINLKKKYKEVR